MTEEGEGGRKVPGPRAKLHTVGHDGAVGLFFINVPGRKADSEVEVDSSTAVYSGQVVEATEFEVSQTAGFHRSHGGTLHGHLVVQVVRHAHEGQLVRKRVHGSEHMHVHGHLLGQHHGVEPVLGVGGHGGDVGGTVEKTFHLHRHVSVGEHPFAHFVHVITHHGDRPVPVGSGSGPVPIVSEGGEGKEKGKGSVKENFFHW